MPASMPIPKERFNVHLNATYGVKGLDTLNQEGQIANLSSSGTKVHFPDTESFKNGAVIAVDKAISKGGLICSLKNYSSLCP